MIRIVIAEDQKMLRGAFASLLNFEDDIEVVAEVPDGASLGRDPAISRTCACSTSRCLISAAWNWPNPYDKQVCPAKS